MNDTTTPKQPDDPGQVANTPFNLLKVAVAAVLFSMVQCALYAFNAIVDWSKFPNSETIHTVLQSLKPALTLGLIRGCFIAVMAVIIVYLGPPLWAILGPLLAAAARNTVRFVADFSRAIRSRPFEPHPDKPDPNKPKV